MKLGNFKIFIFIFILLFTNIQSIFSEDKIESVPLINLEDSLIQNVKKKYKINSQQTNIVFGIGGSGPTKRVPAEKFILFMHMVIDKFDCRFFLATGKNNEEQIILNQIMESDFKDRCEPLDNKNLEEILPIIKS